MDFIPLRDALSFIVDNRGRTCPTSTEGMPLIATNCVKNSTLYPVFEKVRYVEDETLKNWFRAHPQPGDLIFVLKGSPGQVCLTPDPVNFCIAQDMVALRANPAVIDPSYLFAVLRSPETQFNISNLHVGSLISHFKKGDFDRLKIPLPNMSVQKEIGSFYLKISEKIELNNQMSVTLEDMARSLYRSWFVDFDPVHAKMEGRQPAFMDEATAALFPDRFGGDGLPEGWTKVSYLDAISIVGGGTPKTSRDDFWGGDIPWYSVVDAPSSGGIFVFKTEKTITEAGLNGSSARLLPSGATIISARGTVGKLAMVGAEMAFNQSCYGLLGKEGFGDAYTYFSTARAVELLQSMAHGSVFATITRKTFEGIDVTRSNQGIMDAFEAKAGALTGRMLSLALENQTLAALRDSLLPKLMSGELRVGEARERIEEVA